jgi:hypothetical protein
MRRFRILLAASMVFVLAGSTPTLASGVHAASTFKSSGQQQTGALERGYRTGYTDGYQAGYRDNADRAPREFSDKEDYRRADRAYVESYGSLEDYRDGYQQGFEKGYDAGFDRRSFDSNVPSGLARRGTVDSQVNASTQAGGVSTQTSGTVSTTQRSGRVIEIPANTVMRVELLTSLSTEASQKGDRFQARVLEPAEYEGAIVDGRVTRIKRAGKVKGSSELQLTFEQIRMDNRWTDFSAQVVEVVDTQGVGTGDVDEEGGVRSKDTTKTDVVKIGAGSAIGAIIGAIAGGGKGAAIGAVIGGAVGTGGVLATRGKDIHLPRGQHLRIRTAKDTRF